jgi:hypothetical protein
MPRKIAHAASLPYISSPQPYFLPTLLTPCRFLATLANVTDPCVPIPHFDLVNGGDLGDGSPLPVQALTVTMADATSFEDALEQGVCVYMQMHGCTCIHIFAHKEESSASST